MAKKEFHDGFHFDNWTVRCNGETFIVNNHGMKLVARSDEGLEKITFDIDNKTISVKVKTPTLPDKAPRMVDLSNDVEFFNVLHEEIEKVLTEKGDFEKVTPNADRTVFEIS
jgi:hypothetical protein